MKQKLLIMIIIQLCILSLRLPASEEGLEKTLRNLDSNNIIGKQWLVFIAVNQYREWPNLQYPVADAKQLKEVITSRYYSDEVIDVYDQQVTKRNITKLFLELQEKAAIHDSVLIYYAGHGYLDKNSNSGFWIPFDAGTDDVSQRNWLPNTQVRGYISKMKAMHICLIVDACFSGDILEINRGKPDAISNDYFRKAYNRTSRQVLTSGALELVPDKSEFTLYLTQTLEKNNSPYIDPLMLFEEIRLGIRNTTPLFGNLKLTGHQEGASFLLFLKESATNTNLNDQTSGSLQIENRKKEEEIEDVTMKTPDNMIYVKGGSFRMGTREGAQDEWPVHDIIIDDFFIGKYEVTFSDYEKFCRATGEKIPKDKGWGRDKHPVIYVSWYDAVTYCNWLSREHTLIPCYSINEMNVTCDFKATGYRLPTEAEWEYAARGGHKSRGFTYAGHNDPFIIGWFNQNSGRETQSVGTRSPNEIGVYDMSGNVWEWCWDFYDRDYYNKSPLKNPTGPSSGKKHVLRGGSWYNGSNYGTSTIRGYAQPKSKDDYFGFRIVRTKD